MSKSKKLDKKTWIQASTFVLLFGIIDIFGRLYVGGELHFGLVSVGIVMFGSLLFKSRFNN